MFKSFRYAFDGVLFLFRKENNAKFHLLSTFLVLALGFYFNLKTWEWCMLTFAIGFVICAEAFNSALERLCDKVEPNISETIKIIKDLAAGAVLISAFTAFMIGVLVFGSRIIEMLSN